MEKEKARVKKLNEHIVWIKDADNAACYIVIGQEKALVVDTMHGYENIPEIAREFTDLPLVLVNTHGHGDHIGGNHWFSEAYMNEKDYDLEINCRCVRSLAHGNQYFYGCSVSEASNRMLSYVYIKKILTKRD